MSEILLLSGGIDSVAVAAWKRPTVCITFDYGQLAAKAEIRSSEQVCRELELQHEVFEVKIGKLGSGDLAGGPQSKYSSNSEFWPFRNQYIITTTAMFAIKQDIEKVIIGTVQADNRHKDGTQEFIESIDKLLALQEGGVRLIAPALQMTSEELIRVSKIPLEVLAWAHSCHVGEFACGNCSGCIKHSELMRQLGCIR